MKTTNIKIVELNNKSRKGTHIYIKQKGKPARYYKYDGGTIDPYKLYYEDTNKKTKKGTLKTYKNRQIKKTKKGKWTLAKPLTIGKTIKKGIKKTTIKDLHNTARPQEEKKIKQLLKPLVYDTDILKIITEEENMKKLVTRYEYRANLIGTHGQTLATVTHMGRKTPRTVYKELKELLKRGTTIKPNYPQIANLLKNQGYRYNPIDEGELARIDITTIFRKGK